MALARATASHSPRINRGHHGRTARAVWLLGEHDMSTDPELAETIARAVSLDGNDLVLDLSMVEFMEARRPSASSSEAAGSCETDPARSPSGRPQNQHDRILDILRARATPRRQLRGPDRSRFQSRGQSYGADGL